MRVAPNHPATWRGRIQPTDYRDRAVALVRAVTDNVDGLWARLRSRASAV